MIRTVWLAVICLALVSALATGKALRASAPAVVEPVTDKIADRIDSAQDTLSKGDRLEITYVRHDPQPQPVVQPASQAILQPVSQPISQPIEPAAPVVTPPKQTKIIGRHWRDPHAASASSKDSERTESSKKSKTVERKRNQAADRSKPSEPVKPCPRPGAFGDLLRAVNLSPACAS
jgi:hypothetical protein